MSTRNIPGTSATNTAATTTANVAARNTGATTATNANAAANVRASAELPFASSGNVRAVNAGVTESGTELLSLKNDLASDAPLRNTVATAATAATNTNVAARNTAVNNIVAGTNANAAALRNVAARNAAVNNIVAGTNANAAVNNIVAGTNANAAVNNIVAGTNANAAALRNIASSTSASARPSAVSSAALSTTGVATQRQDIQDMLKTINDHLARLNHVDSLQVQPSNNVLTIGSNKISHLCMLHYLSGDPNFLPAERNNTACTSAMANYMVDGKIDLNKLIDLSFARDTALTKEAFVANSKFYYDLYGFNIAMIEYVVNSPEFKLADIETQKRLLENLQRFIRQSILYLQAYMTKYQVIDDKLLKSSYNLLYLYNSMNIRRANFGKNIGDVLALYQRVSQMITENIGIYNKMNIGAIGVSAAEASAAPANPEIAALFNELTRRYALLQEEQKRLITNVKLVETNNEAMTNIISPGIKELASKFNQPI